MTGEGNRLYIRRKNVNMTTPMLSQSMRVETGIKSFII